MELTDSLKEYLKATEEQLKGSDLRLFYARTVRELGPGGQRRAERELGWNRTTIRKGAHELDSGFTCVDAFTLRGRKRAEEIHPNLLLGIQAIAEGQSQIDPKFQSTRLYTRLTAKEVYYQLILQKGYSEETLPTVRTIANKLNGLGFTLRKVKKTQPQKK